MEAKKVLRYVGQIRPELEEGQTAFFRAVLSTMTYDLCGLVHAGGVSNHGGCAGCGECVRLDTWGLVRETRRQRPQVECVKDVESPSLEEFLELIHDYGGTFPRGVV